MSTDLPRRVLPALDDLLGDGWRVDASDLDDADASAFRSLLPDECLSDDFPESEVVADDDVAFVLPDTAGVYAMATIFRSDASAAIASEVLRRDEFVSCFARAVASEADTLDADGEGSVLGPVMQRELDDDRHLGGRVAVFSSASATGVVPIVLRVAVVTSGRAVVVMWSADRDDPDATVRWRHVVERVDARCRRHGGATSPER